MKEITGKHLFDQLVIFIVILVVMAIPFFFLYINTDSIVITEAGKQATSVAITTAKFLEDDFDQYERLLAIDDYSAEEYDKAYYQKMLGIFNKIKTDTGADFVFTEKIISDTEIAYILDGEDPGSENFSPIGSVDTLAEAERRSFSEGIAVSSGLIRDPVWGVYITGFAPIRNPVTGEVVSVVGVDFSSDHVLEILRSVRNFLVLTWVVLTILIFLLINRILENRNKTVRTDYLTRLYTKQYLLKYLPELVRKSKATHQTFSLMMMDIDMFKEINDRFGHLCGDRVLSGIAHDIQYNVRDTDQCFRYGGDEFIIVLPGSQAAQAAAVGNRIREYLQRNPIALNEEGTEKRIVTLSIGVTEWQKATAISQLIEQADQAMYESKRLGRDRVTIYSVGSENESTGGVEQP